MNEWINELMNRWGILFQIHWRQLYKYRLLSPSKFIDSIDNNSASKNYGVSAMGDPVDF